MGSATTTMEACAPVTFEGVNSTSMHRVLDETFRTRRGTLKRFAERLTGNETDAEDLVQQAFLKAYEQDFKMSRERLLPWLTTVIRRLSIDRLRRTVVHQRFADLQWSFAVVVDADPPPVEELEACINALPEAQQRTFRLWCCGASYQAIAEAENLPIGTVAARVQRAKVQLRALCGTNDKGRRILLSDR